MNINEPWEASIDWASDFPRGSHVFDGHGNEIATNVDGFQATLIAAAPDLLEALERVLRVSDRATCKACMGTSAKAKASPVIIAHGAKSRRFELTRSPSKIAA